MQGLPLDFRQLWYSTYPPPKKKKDSRVRYRATQPLLLSGVTLATTNNIFTSKTRERTTARDRGDKRYHVFLHIASPSGPHSPSPQLRIPDPRNPLLQEFHSIYPCSATPGDACNKLLPPRCSRKMEGNRGTDVSAPPPPRRDEGTGGREGGSKNRLRGTAELW